MAKYYEANISVTANPKFNRFKGFYVANACK